jgi:hypothetical protein
VALVRLAHSLVKKYPEATDITAMHLSPSNEINQYNFAEYESESFKPIKFEAKKLGMKVNLFFKPSQDIEAEIIQTANEGNFDFLLIGVGKSVFSGTLLGRIVGYTNRLINPSALYNSLLGREKLFDDGMLDEKVKNILKSVNVPVGVLIDKKLEKVENIFVPVFSKADAALVQYAKKFISNSDARVVILDSYNAISENIEFKEAINAVEQVAPENIGVLNDKRIDRGFLNEQDLIILSLDGLSEVVKTQPGWLSLKASVLIVKA